jgi:DNA-binding transcriptional LysR family regulator
MVLSGEVDIGVGGVGPEDPKLRIVSIVEDAFGIVAPEDHPLAKRRSAEWSDLKGERIIGNATLETIRDHASLRWVTAEPVLALRNRASLLGSIRGGIGVTILPRLACPPDEYGLRFTQLKNPRLTRTVGIIARDGATLLPAAASMEALAAASLAEFAAEKGAKVLRAANPRRRA